MRPSLLETMAGKVVVGGRGALRALLLTDETSAPVFLAGALSFRAMLDTGRAPAFDVSRQS
jgi:hypothetical protein